jgi:hypothetical protein
MRFRQCSGNCSFVADGALTERLLLSATGGPERKPRAAVDAPARDLSVRDDSL